MILVGGTTITQVLSILASPVLTRLFGPEAFGLSALFVSITSIISVFVCLRYELAIMLPETEEDAVNLVGVSIFAVILITLLTIPVSYFGSTSIALWLNAPELGAYMWLVPPTTFLSGLFLALNYWNTRTRQFGRLANVRVAGAVTTTGSQIGAGIAGFTNAGVLIGGSILGSFISTFALMVQVWRDDSHLFRKGLHWERMKQGIIRYRNFPLFDSWAALLNSISTSLPFFLLSIYFSPAIVGFYSLGNRILKLPLGFIGSSINQVFYQRAAEAKHKGDEVLRALSHAIFLRLAILGSYPIFLLMVIGQEVFIVVFGGNWAEAGVFTQILALWIFITFLTNPMGPLFAVHEKQKEFLIFNILLVISRAATLIIGGMTGDARVAIFLFSATGVIAWGAICYWILVLSHISVRQLFREFSPYLAMMTLFFGILLAGKLLVNMRPEFLVVAGAILSAPYYGFVLRRDPELQKFAFATAGKIGFVKKILQWFFPN